MEKEMVDEPIQISEHVFWVGTHDARDSFQCNPYVIRAGDAGVLIDPGSVLYFSGYQEKLRRLIDLKAVTYIVLQHQDPDVCGVIAQLADMLRAEGKIEIRKLSWLDSARHCIDIYEQAIV